MPTQPPSDRTRAPGMHPSPEFWILTSGFPPNPRNKPNPRTGTACRAPNPRNKPNFHLAHPPNTQNKPNLPPRPPCPTSKYAKRTQFTPCTSLAGPRSPHLRETNPIRPCPSLGHEPKMRNEPNSRTPPHLPGLVIPAKAGIQKSQPTNKKCKTNPIYPPPSSRRPKNAKRTQFPRRTKD